jgi:hypothetical protein
VNTTRQRSDDQYVMPVEASRRGAHRARVTPLLAALPFVAVAVVVTGVVALAWTLFGGSGADTAQQAGAVSTASRSASGATASGAKTTASTKPATTKPAATKTTATRTSAGQTPAATVDKTAAVVVRNSTRTKGLAAKAAAALVADGWTINGTPDNYRPTIDSTVFYAQDSQLANAQAVAKALGIDLVTKNAARAGKGVTVILGADYQP